ncbi:MULTISPECIES: flagellar protein FlgN [Stutzerimonas]|nr:flagellar protein FlgN [Stutzerimonas balearica]WIX02943.1 flagellar protein FlgN [Pseudomonas sp. AR5]MBD3738233.1 flagellar protein FlgN [Stutzerimonas balearica]MBK3746365.1 flagellar protein FlgN [Stutzerimonas balearica]MBK3824561.1 flagellar protein FlgN [Stutzerimonas balearica]MBK3854252.1 flagellar protein FlgN [Stutzerimonas balearica]
MNQRDRLLAVVADDIRQDCEQYLALRDLMQALYTFLLERDSAEIDRLNLQITRHVEALEVRARRRAKVLGAFRLSGDGDGMQRLLASYPADQRAELQAGWQQLGSLARHCQQLNERNGKLLAMHHDLLQQLLGDQRDARVYQPHAY